MEQIMKVCTDIHKNEEEAQNIQASNYYQDFGLYNLRELAANDEKDFKPMNEHQLENLLTNFVEYFPEFIESSEKVMSAIDYKFETKTKSFIYKVICVFAQFLVPYLMYLFGRFSTLTNQILLCISLTGWIGIYSLELIAIYIQGVRVYFLDSWNYLD